MLIRYGFDIEIMLWQPTTLITAMDVHESQRQAVVWENEFETSPGVRVQTLFNEEGNKLRRLTADPGVLGMKLTGVVKNSGALDASNPHAELVPVENLPPAALPYLRASRYCETSCYPILLGLLSARSKGVTRRFRPFATTRITACASAIRRRARPAPPLMRWRSRSGSAATSRILLSRFAVVSISPRATAMVTLAI